MTEVEVLTRVERRHIWSDAERVALIDELDFPGNACPWWRGRTERAQ